MKLQHTPGPWKIKGPSHNVLDATRCGDYAIIDTAGEIIAESFNQIGKKDFRPAEANARLIAAAPEMLEALIKIYSDIKNLGHQYVEYTAKEIIESVTGLSIEEVLS